MKIVITGVTGFVGNYVARLLVHEGHQVIGVRYGTDFEKIADIIEQIDLYDTSELEQMFRKESKIDAVVHLATAYGRDNDYSKVFSANVQLPFKIMSLVAEYQIPHFINTDTFFNSNTAKYAYLQAYTLSKWQCLAWAELFAEKKLMKVTNMKLFHVYGAADDANKFVPQMVSKCLANEPEIALTSGEQRRDFVHVTDVAAAYLVALLNSPTSFIRYLEIGTGKTVSVRELVEKIHEKTGSSSLLRFGSLEQRVGEFAEAAANPREIIALGWMPRYDVDMGLDEIIRVAKR